MRDSIRVKRGMVFWFDDNIYNKGDLTIKFQDRNMHSHIESGKRPYLVISCDISNENSMICNIIPITSSKVKVDKNLPQHVIFTIKGEQNTIMTEQIRTVDIIALGGYIYTLSDVVLKQVEYSLANQLGLIPPKELVIDEFLEDLGPYINKYVEKKFEDLKNKISIDSMTNIALSVGEKINETLYSAELELSDKMGNNNIYEPNMYSKRSENTLDNNTSKHANTRYSLDDRIRFNNDCKQIGIKVAAEKWGMTTSTAYAFRYKTSQILKEINKKKEG